MNAFDELRQQVATLENSFKNLTIPKADGVSDEQYDQDLYTHVYEAYDVCLMVEDQLKKVRSSLRKKYKVTDKDIKKWIEESDEKVSPSGQSTTPQPTNFQQQEESPEPVAPVEDKAESQTPDNLEPPKLVRQNAMSKAKVGLKKSPAKTR